MNWNDYEKALLRHGDWWFNLEYKGLAYHSCFCGVHITIEKKEMKRLSDKHKIKMPTALVGG